ncbi:MULTISPECIES: acyltransferase family protein [Gemella]|uniref:acyltransferase family protein n=1 Tax=Gemella TaxID=1378 RepID=UPI0007684603|nr:MULTISPECIES: acyltransferase [Gemella]AME09176.1 acyltransferase [Gemella sp. oral taxon 928]AXI26809.1 acyltransferase [Gemella sp. ND 6198]
MDIIILLLFSGLIFLLPKGNKDYLDKNSTNGLKGLLAIGIILHHLSQWISSGETFSNFQYMGTYIVSIFFFLSGYGLYIQTQVKSDYLTSFFRKRLLKILIPFVFISGIYLVYRVVYLKEIINLNFFYNLFLKHTTIIYNGWFVDIIIFTYIFFYISFKFIKNTTMSITVNFIFIVLYIVVAIKLNYGFWWYNSILTFIIGLVWAKNKKVIDYFFGKYYILSLMLFTILIFISHKYNIVLTKVGLVDAYSYAISANLDNIIFTIYFMLIIKNIDFSNNYLLKLGTISFELYMIHGLAITFFGKYFTSSNLNDILFTIVVFLVSIISAKAIHLIIINIQKRWLIQKDSRKKK